MSEGILTTKNEETKFIDGNIQLMGTEKKNRPIPWASGGLAVLVALLIVGVTLPDIVHVRAELRSGIACFLVTPAFLPAICIFTLGRRWVAFQWLAWMVLTFFILIVFFG